MKWKNSITWLLLLLSWIGLAAWQLSEYKRVHRLAFAELRREAATVSSALVGGIRTHRRMGVRFEENLQRAIDDLVDSETVVAAAIEAEDGKRLALAGSEELLDSDGKTIHGKPAFAFHDQFTLSPDGGGLPHWPGQGGRGQGQGWGRLSENPLDSDAGGARKFHTVLLLDATSTESRCRGEARLRGLVMAAGTLVLLSVTLAWRATLRTAEARGRARLLESETRHYSDLSQAAAGLAHETRNPLGLIRGWAQRLAEDGSNGSEHRERVQTIVEECDRVTARINQFLTFARPSNPETAEFSVKEVIDQLATLLEPIFEAKHIEFQFDQKGPSPMIRADREMFRQALFNLVQNAVQFSADGGAIEIVLRQSAAGRKRVEVSDHGCGVPRQAVESLFTPYFTTRTDGTGLGLAIVRRIAMSHGWRTGHAPQPGGGSVFWLDDIDG